MNYDRQTDLLDYFNIENRAVAKTEKCPSRMSDSNCFDIATVDEADIFEFLNADDIENPKEKKEEQKKRIVFLFGNDENNIKAYCYSIDYINQIEPMSHIYTECPEKNKKLKNAHGMGLTRPIIRIDLTSPVYIYLKEFLYVLQHSKERIFLLLPRMFKNKHRTVEATASYGALDITAREGYYLSADHCQKNTEKSLYNIYECNETKLYRLLKLKANKKSPKKLSSKKSSPKKPSPKKSLIKKRSTRSKPKEKERKERKERKSSKKRISRSSNKRKERKSSKRRVSPKRRERKERKSK